MRLAKVGVSLSSLTLSAGILYTHVTDSLFPGLTIGVFLSALVFILFVTYDSDLNPQSVTLYLGALVVFAVLYRLYVFVFPATIVGLDPFIYASEIRRVLGAAHTNVISLYFYSNAPFAIVYPAESALMTGLSPTNSLGIYSVFIGVLVPLSVAVLTIQIAARNEFRKGLIGATIATVATISVQYAYWPVAQTLAVAYWCTFVPLLVRYYEVRSKRAFLCAALLLIALSFTHKLPLLLAFGTLVSIVFFTEIQQIVRRIRRAENPIAFSFQPIGSLFTLLTGVLLLLQWSYLTEFITSVIVVGMGVLTDPSVGPPPLDNPPTAAIPAAPGIVGILVRRGNALVLIPLGGLAWIYAFYTRRDDPAVKVLLASTSISIGLLGLVVANAGKDSSGTTNPQRLMFFAEPILIPLVAIVFGSVSGRAFFERVSNRAAPALSATFLALTTLLVVGIIVSQVFSGLAVPDFSRTPREYLTSQEVEGKGFGYEYTQGRVYTDWYLTVARPYLRQPEQRYQSMETELLNANITEKNHKYVAYRTEVDIFLTSSGQWLLTWNPERNLDGEYNRIYANGGLSLYERYKRSNREQRSLGTDRNSPEIAWPSSRLKPSTGRPSVSNAQ